MTIQEMQDLVEAAFKEGYKIGAKKHDPYSISYRPTERDEEWKSSYAKYAVTKEIKQ